MSRPTHDQVRTELKNFGGTQVDDFSMAEPERKIKGATDGYCEGIALDWIRRVLQGGRPWLNATRQRGDPDHLYLQKAQSQAARQALAFMEWVPTVNRWEEQYDVARKRLEKNFNQGLTDKAASLQSLNIQLFNLLTINPNARVELTPPMIGLIGEFFGNPVSRVMDRHKLEELYETSIPQMKRQMEVPPPFDPTGSKAKYLHDGMRKHAYTDFSKTLDAGSKKKRSFSNMSLLCEGASGLSATNIVRLKSSWETDYKEWSQRDLSAKRYVYWWADGVYFNVRLDEERTCGLVLIGATEDGSKELWLSAIFCG